jgi:hypothetical protein
MNMRRLCLAEQRYCAGVPTLAAMDTLSKAFLRLAPGRWLCKASVTIESSEGRRVQVTPGVTYLRGRPLDGVDVAGWLDEYYEAGTRPEGWRSVPDA